jgi:hypothetical protein
MFVQGLELSPIRPGKVLGTVFSGHGEAFEEAMNLKWQLIQNP